MKEFGKLIECLLCQSENERLWKISKCLECLSIFAVFWKLWKMSRMSIANLNAMKYENQNVWNVTQSLDNLAKITAMPGISRKCRNRSFLQIPVAVMLK